MPNILFKPFKVTAAELVNLPIVEGQFIVVTDTKEFYLDTGSSTRTKVSADLSTFAPLASPALTGTPTAPTATAGTDTTQIATTAFVQAAIANITDGDGVSY